MKKIFTFIPLFVFCLLASMKAMAQPANDNCSGAIAITVEPYSATCAANIAAVTTAATASTITETLCSTTSDNDDIFYSFTATAGSMVLRFSGMTATSGTTTALGYHIFSGTCGALVQEASCSTGFGTAGAGTTLITGLTAGQDYFLQLFTGGTSNSATFNFCLQEAAPPPANDDCANATVLNVGATCVNTAGTTVGATQSQAAAPCAGNPDDDVWFSFVANNTDAQITLAAVTAVVGTSTDIYFQVLDGTCGALTSLMCTDPNTGIVGGLTPGNTYFIRVYSFATTSWQTFNICVNDLAAAPTVCTSLTAPAAGAQVGTTPTLTWSATANASGYDIYLDTNNPPTTLFASRENNSGTSYAITTPLPTGTYYWYVVPRNSAGAMTGCAANTRSFIALDPPVNDECSTATVLTPTVGGGACTGIAGTTAGATPSSQAAPTCSGTGANDDVWYSFTATGAAHTIIISGATSATAAAFYSGASCGAALQITGACGTTSSGDLFLPVTGLSAGTIYYVRVYTTSTTVTTSATFTICLTSPTANDNCSGATVLTPAAPGATCTGTAGSTIGATPSTQANPTCSATGINDDVWYSFTATAASHTVIMTGASSATAVSVYSGADCAAAAELPGACGTTTSGATEVVVTGLTPGSVYWIRVYSTSATVTTISNFNICVLTAPVNDECTGAINLAVSTTLNCASPVTGSTYASSPSGIAAPSCSGTGANDDVWYSFTATRTAHTVQITGASTTTAAAIYSGTCPALTQIANSCGSGGTGASGLTIGNIYYVRVYSTSTTVGTYSDFTICVVSGTPANDECSGAIQLTASATQNCGTSYSGTTTGATPSLDAAPSCSATGAGDDVWYSFVATNTIHNVLISNATNTAAAAIYTGSCGSLTQVAGACGSSPDGSAYAAGLVIGQTYYVRVYSTSTVGGTYTNFDICIVGGSPANDECANAISLNVSTDNSCSNAVAGTTLGASQSAGTTPGCSPTGINDDVWYSFVATGTTHSVLLLSSTNTAAVSVYSGTCGSLVAGACASTQTLATGLTIGNTYYVRVYTTSTLIGTYSNFSICIGVPITNDNCSGAISLTASANGNCNPISGTTLGSTQTTGETVPTCSATGINDDVWYSFVATSATHTVSLIDASSASAAAVYSGSCGSLTEVACAGPNNTVTGLTVGNTYYVRVYTTSSTATIFANFKICVSGTPANNECGGAVVLTNGIPATGNNAGATQSQAPEACGTATATVANDVWYQFTAASSGTALVSVYNVGTLLDAVVQVYSGSCGSLVNIGCADGPGDGGSEVVVLNGLVAGQTYYIRVYGFAATDIGTFNIVVSGAALPVNVAYFKGNRQNAGNKLEWRLECSNINSAVVELERSTDGRNFVSISSFNINAANCGNVMSYLDNERAASTYYYRLRISEAGTSDKLSNVVALIGGQKGFEIVNISPNPASVTATLELVAAQKTTMEIVITDIAGRRMQNQRVKLLEGLNKLPLQVQGLGSGVYYVTVVNENGERRTLKLVKQ
jgi:hypothetical protein